MNPASGLVRALILGYQHLISPILPGSQPWSLESALQQSNQRSLASSCLQMASWKKVWIPS